VCPCVLGPQRAGDLRTVVAVAFRSLLRMRSGSSGAYNLTVRSSRRRFMASCYLCRILLLSLRTHHVAARLNSGVRPGEKAVRSEWLRVGRHLQCAGLLGRWAGGAAGRLRWFCRTCGRVGTARRLRAVGFGSFASPRVGVVDRFGFAPGRIGAWCVSGCVIVYGCLGFGSAARGLRLFQARASGFLGFRLILTGFFGCTAVAVVRLRQYLWGPNNSFKPTPLRGAA